MHKMTLSDAQLLELKRFIEQRGIKELDVIHEVLDHFACKVEELMEANPNLNFQEAIQKAHRSFGQSGFRPMIRAYELQVEKIMWQTFKQALVHAISSPIIIAAIAVALCGHLLMNHVPQLIKMFIVKEHSFYLIMCLLLIGQSIQWYIYYKIRKRIGITTKLKAMQHWQKKVLSIPTLPFTLIIILSMLQHTVLTNWIIAPVFILMLIRIVAQYRTYQKMEERFGTNFGL